MWFEIQIPPAARHVLPTIVILVICVLAAGCNNLLYVPNTHPPYSQCFDELGMRHVALTAADGVRIYAWYAPAENAGAPTLAYFTGNAGNVGLRACLVRPYAEKGYGVFILSYRGYGGSSGQPSERGLYLDAEAALDYLETAAGVSRERTVLYGQSLGAAVAVEMALRRRAAALVLLAPFTSAPAAARSIAWYLPVPYAALFTDRYDSLSKIGQIEEPLLIVHGTADHTIPADHGKALFETATAEHKEMILIPGADHNDLHGKWRDVSSGDRGETCAALATLDDSCGQTWVIRFLGDVLR